MNIFKIILAILPLILETYGTEYWHHFGHNEKGNRYSSLTQINRDNVKNLTEAWTYKYGGENDFDYAHEVTPIMVDDGSGSGTNVLILCTPWNTLIALNPVTGQEVWKQTGAEARNASFYQTGPRTCRGLSTWLDPMKSNGRPCRRYVYMGTLSAKLVAVDAATGRFCQEFGNNGILNLVVPRAIKRMPSGQYVQNYGFLSPPQVIRNTVVIGDSINDVLIQTSPHGQPRGFDCRTGRKKWQFDVIPQNTSDPAYKTWHNGTSELGGGNVWAPISGDEETGIVYLGTSSAHYDYWGGNRKGKNEYTSGVLALNAESGKKIWFFQTVKHDVWNYDIGAQPIVTTINHEGSRKKVILQLTKTGMLFILDAISGISIFPVEERPVPPSRAPGDEAWPTQTFVVGELGNLVPQNFTEDDVFDFQAVPQLKEECLSKIRDMSFWGIRNGTGKIFTPSELVYGTIEIPGNMGGGNWMSLAVHPEKQIAIMPVNHILTVRTLFHANGPSDAGHCSAGTGMVDAPFKSCLSPFFGFPPNVAPLPCYKPPWAKLIAVDLQKGKIKWMRPFATPFDYPQNKNYGSRRVYGGVVITESGLIFATGGLDKKLWVYDLETGNELWESEILEFDPTCVPMTYMVDGRQFVIVNSGGHWTSFNRGDKIYAFALPPEVITPQTTTTTQPSSADSVWCSQFMVSVCLVLVMLIAQK